jgi:hypothetical protein
VASQHPNILNTEGAPLAPGQPGRPAQRSRLSWLRALPLLARPVTQTVPWATLLAGCLAGTVYLAIMTRLAGTSQPLGQGNLRLAFLPAIAALAFVPRAPFRPLTLITPVPAWTAPAGHVLLAAPIVGLTCWAQLRISASTIPAHVLERPPAVYPLIAQLTGWCAIVVAAAAWVDRSRYADLGGAVAAPISFAAIALAWYAPIISGFLTEPHATPSAATITWYAVAAAASTLACAAMRDQWERYARGPHRLCLTSEALRRRS